MTVIRGRQLTTFDVSPDGESFAIHVTDEQARPASLVLPAECLNALMMTLPARWCGARCVGGSTMKPCAWCTRWGAGRWRRARRPAAVIVTLRTPDGFQVSFGLAALELLRMATRSASASAEASGIISN